MATFAIPAALREDSGKGASRRLRRRGMVPAVVYGGERPPRSIEVEHRLIAKASEDEAFYTTILDLVIDDKRKQRVVLRDMQRHPFKAQIMHLDFMRISDDEKLRMNVPLHFINEEESPAGKMSGVVVSHLMNEVEILCLPKDLPEYIEVDLASIDVGSIVHLSDVTAPEGVEFPGLHADEGEDPVVASAQHVGGGETAADEDAEEDDAPEADVE